MIHHFQVSEFGQPVLSHQTRISQVKWIAASIHLDALTHRTSIMLSLSLLTFVVWIRMLTLWSNLFLLPIDLFLSETSLSPAGHKSSTILQLLYSCFSKAGTALIFTNMPPPEFQPEFQLLPSNTEASTSTDLSCQTTILCDFNEHNKDRLLHSSGTSIVGIYTSCFKGHELCGEATQHWR